MKLNFINQKHVVNYLVKSFSILLFLSFAIVLKAQNQTVSLSSGIMLKEAFIEIEKQTRLSVDYNNQTVNANATLKKAFTNARLSEVLPAILSEVNCTYSIQGSHILVNPNSPKQEARRITGTIVDTNGESIIGANVVEKGTTNGIVTDLNGGFSLNISNNAILAISYIGYNTQEVTVGNQSSLRIILSENALGLEEVIVVGYGTQKKANLTGSVASLRGNSIAKSQTTNSSNSLIGQIPGIIAKQTNGAPGSGSDIYIRGVATYQGGTSPTYIIDGIERRAEDFARIDPNEIESVNVLKDAASASVFGMRAANGVILVTTQRGSSSKAKIHYTGNVSVQKPTILPKFANSADYAIGFNKYMGSEIYTADEIRKFADGSDPDNYPDTDWYGLMLSQDAVQQTHNLTVNGGNNDIKYFTSFGYIDQKGLWERLHYDRYSLRSNLDADITRTTHLSIDVSGRVEHDNGGGINSGVFESLVRNTPVLVAIYQNGLYAKPSQTHVNIMASNDPSIGYNKPRSTSVLTRLELAQDLPFVTQGLKLKGIVSYDKNNYKQKSWSTSPYVYLRDLNDPDVYNLITRGSPSLSLSSNDNEYIEYQGHLTYDRVFGNHSLSGLLMALARQTNYQNMSIRRNSFDSDAMDQINAGNTAGQTLSGGDSQSARMSYVGRINYAFQSKYLLEGNVRRDASENFSPKKRWGTFASVSAGWVLSEEDFFSSIKEQVNFLKIRASYGTLGSDNTGGVSFPYYSRFQLYGGGGGHSGGLPNNLGDYVFGDQIIKGLYPGAIANEQATWETSTKTNLAVDLTLFNAFNLSLDYFYEKRTNILAQRSAEIPGSFGATLPLENIGEVRNQGVDATLNFRYQVGDVRFTIGGNMTFARNKIIEMAEAVGTSEYLKRTGRPIHSYYGYKTDGLFKTEAEIANYAKQEIAGIDYQTKPGDIKYVDVNGDQVVNADDRTYLGYGNVPELVYGLTGSLEYKGFDFSFLFQGAGRVQMQLTGGMVMPFYNDSNLPQFWVTDSWNESNPNARYPRLAQSSHNIHNTDFPPVQTYLYDASYLRLKNIELGYSLPKKWFDHTYLSQVRFYLSGQNLLTFTKLPQIDPENTHIQGWNYPLMKAFNAGININF
jgi:TonB-linked SusC/RagA family outer membrane protein